MTDETTGAYDKHFGDAVYGTDGSGYLGFYE